MLKNTLLFTFFLLHSSFSIAFAADWFLPQTGQTSCYNSTGTVISCTGTGQDGDTLTGQAWPNPRFTVNMQVDGVTPNGTVTDNLTGLIWLKKVNCTETVGGIDRSSNLLTWADALTWSNNLASGACDLTDGSTVGQWRVPNIVELESLVNAQQSNPATWLNGQGFAVVASYYWSSSTVAYSTGSARQVNFSSGGLTVADKTGSYSVWPVRGGQ